MSIDQIELPLEDKGEAPTAERSGEAVPTAQGNERSGLGDTLIERIIERGNLLRALKRVQQIIPRAYILSLGVPLLGPS